MIKCNTKVVATLLAMGLVAGCSSGDPVAEAKDADDDAPQVVEERYGAISVEFSTPRLWEDGGVEVQAQFMDARGVAVPSALEALEVWTPRRGLELGDCQTGPIDETSTPPTEEPMSLHLLDVGHIEVTSPTDRTDRIEARQLPDLLSSFHGVVYGTEWVAGPDQAAIDYFPGEEYRFSAPGSPRVGKLDVTIRAPEPVVLAATNGEVIRDQRSMVIGTGEPLELVWETAREGDSTDRQVFVEVSAGHGPDQPRIECRAVDNGAFSIPRARLQELSRHSDSVDLTLRRVEQTETSVDGLDQVEVYFATTDRLELIFD